MLSKLPTVLPFWKSTQSGTSNSQLGDNHHNPHARCYLKVERIHLASAWPWRASPLKTLHTVMVSCSPERSSQGITCRTHAALVPLFTSFRRLFGCEEEPPSFPLALRASLVPLAALFIVALSSSTKILHELRMS